jgi:hypothetical protein
MHLGDAIELKHPRGDSGAAACMEIQSLQIGKTRASHAGCGKLELEVIMDELIGYLLASLCNELMLRLRPKMIPVGTFVGTSKQERV